MAIDRRILGWPARVFNREMAACSSVPTERARTPVRRCRTGAPSVRRGGATRVGRAFGGVGNPARYDACGGRWTAAWPEVKALRRANALTYTRWLRGQDTASLFEDFLQEARAHLDHVTRSNPG